MRILKNYIIYFLVALYLGWMDDGGILYWSIVFGLPLGMWLLLGITMIGDAQPSMMKSGMDADLMKRR